DCLLAGERLIAGLVDDRAHEARDGACPIVTVFAGVENGEGRCRRSRAARERQRQHRANSDYQSDEFGEIRIHSSGMTAGGYVFLTAVLAVTGASYLSPGIFM